MRKWVKVLPSILVADSPIACALRLNLSQEVLLVGELWTDCAESAPWRGYLLRESGPKSGLIAVKVLSKALPALYVDVGVAMSLIGPFKTSLTSNEVLLASLCLHCNISILLPGFFGKREVRALQALNEIPIGRPSFVHGPWPGLV